MRTSEGGIFNNAAQVVEPHLLHLEHLAPNAGSEPTGKLADAIAASFGSFAEFKSAEIHRYRYQNFGSGWTWLKLQKR